jgi:putative membrane protein
LLLAIFRTTDDDQPKKFGRLEFYLIAIPAIAFLRALVTFFFFRFYLEEDRLVVKKGWLKKETKIIPLEKIQTVSIEQGPLHQLLHVVKLSVDTAGSQTTELTIDALRRPMAEALRGHLLRAKQTDRPEETGAVKAVQPMIELGDRDLLKLSISANHLEAFFVLLLFLFGIYENIKEVARERLEKVEGSMPSFSMYSTLFLTAAVVLITLLFSTGRVFFRYYGFKVAQAGKGLHIKSGMTHVQERILLFKKVQYISWQRSWMRRLLRFWMLEYHTAGNEKVNNAKQNGDIKLPVTQERFLPSLIQDYFPLPQITHQTAITIHPAFVMRKILTVGLLPALGAIVWGKVMLDEWLYWALVWIAFSAVYAKLAQKKFRLWALEDVAFIKRGHFGEEYILLSWHKLQSVKLVQSIYQKRKGLATVYLLTAAGEVRLPYISLEAARQVVDYAVYKAEVYKDDKKVINTTDNNYVDDASEVHLDGH